MCHLISRADAVAQGYTIDDHGPGRPIAFKGRRFAPTAVVGVFTPHEEELRAALQAYESLWVERVSLLGELSPELQELRGQAARVLMVPAP